MVTRKVNTNWVFQSAGIAGSWIVQACISPIFFSITIGLALLLLVDTLANANAPSDTAASQFEKTWNLARAGKHTDFRQQMPASMHYILYPYLQYEDYRSRLSTVPPGEISGFLETYRSWAFSSSLRQVWLRGMGRKGQWPELLQYSISFKSIGDAETRCHQLHARINQHYQKTAKAALLKDAESMWLTGKSQHKACDPVFSWMDRHGHLGDNLVWGRILLAFRAGNTTLANYLKRRLPVRDQQMADAYTQLWKRPARGFASTRHWSDSWRTREVILAALLRQARNDPDLALKYWRQVEPRFAWSERASGKILYDIALFSAVALEGNVLDRFAYVPASAVDDKLLQWRLRTALNHQRWDELLVSFNRMSAVARQAGRFRFWQATALEQQGRKAEADRVYKTLAREATFWGFLAADQLNQDYRICPLTPVLDPLAVSRVAGLAGVKRALELRKVGLDDFAGREWYRATVSLNKIELRAAAALAIDKGWPSQAIVSLGKSGDTRYYDWRFPIDFEAQVNLNANRHNLDPAWIYGLMRAESALNPRAISPAKAYGLMQLLPATAKRLSARAGVKYTHRNSLLDPTTNIAFGTAEMDKLLQRYNGVPAYVTGAYNAGPGAVDRWLKQRPDFEIERWVELMPYYETRDYIPRVMAFSTLYAWRLGARVIRVSYRLRHAAVAPGGMGLTNVSCQL